MGDGGLPEKRHFEIAEALNERFSAQGLPLHKVKGRARESAEASSSLVKEDAEALSEARSLCEPALAGEHEKIEVKVKVKVNNLKEQESERKRLHKVMLAKYGNRPAQYPKDGITIFRPFAFFAFGKEIELRFDNAVFEVDILKFAMGQKGRWAKGLCLLEIQRGALLAIEAVDEEFISEEPKYFALWRYGMRGAPKWVAAMIESEEEAERLAGKLERDIIEEIPRFREWNKRREYRRLHRLKAGKGFPPDLPPRVLAWCLMKLIFDEAHRTRRGDAGTGDRGDGALKVPDVKGWKHEPGEGFFYYLLVAASIFLGSVVGYFTVDPALTSSRTRFLGDAILLAFLWPVVLLFAVMLQDSRATYLRRRNTYSRFSNEPKERVEENLRNVLGSMGIGYQRGRVTTPLERVPLSTTIDVYEYRLEGVGFGLVLEHFGPDEEGSDREGNLLLVGPITREEHGRILEFIRTLAALEEGGPPSLHVYGTRPRDGP